VERQGRGVAEGPQQGAWGRGVIDARGAAIGDWWWTREEADGEVVEEI